MQVFSAPSPSRSREQRDTTGVTVGIPCLAYRTTFVTRVPRNGGFQMQDVADLVGEMASV